jgi:hypothetical protein
MVQHIPKRSIEIDGLTRILRNVDLGKCRNRSDRASESRRCLKK